jgi:hypothetical protein
MFHTSILEYKSNAVLTFSVLFFKVVRYSSVILFGYTAVSLYVTSPNAVMESDLYEGVSKRSQTGRLERELQMVQLSASRCSCIAILWVSLVSFVAITLCVLLNECLLFISLWLSPETFGYTLV